MLDSAIHTRDAGGSNPLIGTKLIFEGRYETALSLFYESLRVSKSGKSSRKPPLLTRGLSC